MFRFVWMIKEAVWKFHGLKKITYNKETVTHVKDMLYHLRKRSDVNDAWDGTYGILKKLKDTNAPEHLIKLAEKQYELLSKAVKFYLIHWF